MPNQSSPPNILVFVPHDLGDHLHCYGHGSVKSPNLDHFAGQGMRFTNNFTAAPECTPSRAGMLTGLYTHQTGLMGLCHRGWEFSPHTKHLAQLLTEGGYQTHAFGFQHETGGDPARLGYQHIHAQENMSCHSVCPSVCEFLQSNEALQGPWFAHVGFMHVHRGTPWPQESTVKPSQIEIPPYLPDNEQSRQEFSRFHQSIADMDAAVGSVLDTLETLKVADNTLVIFTTDHGIGFPRAKSTFYDPGIRTALMMRWPARFADGVVCDELISNLDLCPTVLEAAEVTIPQQLEGRSFLPLLEAKPYTPREAVFGALYYDAKYDPMHYVRTNRYKYIRSFAVRLADRVGADKQLTAKHESGQWIRAGDTDVARSDTWQSIAPPYDSVQAEELYDLEKDPLETHNLVADPAHAAILKNLQQQMQAMMIRSDSPLLKGHVPPSLSSTGNQVCLSH